MFPIGHMVKNPADIRPLATMEAEISVNIRYQRKHIHTPGAVLGWYWFIMYI